MFTYEGVFVRSFGEFGSEDGQYELPFALAFDFDSNLVVLDCKNNRVQVVDPLTGRFIRKFGNGPGKGDGSFYEPYALTLDLEGNIIGIAPTWVPRDIPGNLFLFVNHGISF